MNSIELKQKWQRGEVSPGMWLRLTDPTVCEMVSSIDFDWVLFDGEHVAFDMQTLQILLMALKTSPAVPLLRVPGSDPIFIKRVLDIGMAGILVPHVRTEEDVRAAVAACKYPPLGIRGTGPRRPSRYGDLEREYLATANDQTIVTVMIETIEAVNNIDKILAVPGLDGFFIGKVDLTASMGLLPDFDDPRVTQAVDTVLTKAKATKVARGSGRAPESGADVAASVRNFFSEGYNVIPVGADESFVKDGARAALHAFRRAAEGNA